ncbi:Fic family protein [Flavobacterium sp.]|uniref:Fic family protein n=1 Tax=Flavobacterium sp. TaxID=239 RepID=UPI002634ACB4|nr:Fic family protein [Flavobacterium sp.]
MNLLKNILLSNYIDAFPNEAIAGFDALIDAEISTDNFSFYTSVASVFSSKIEGEAIELDSYIKHKRFGIEFQPDYTKKIDDLYNAYSFAKENSLNENNLSEVHKLLSKHLISKNFQGKYRNQNMFVTTDDGKIEYVAALPEVVSTEMKLFFEDINQLLNTSLSFEETFFYASLIHLVFVKIHPFNDGNGRTARLFEKWFLAEKIGDKAWFIQSEKNYYNHHQNYYSNLRVLGLEYEDLDYSKALPFLKMLVQSLNS